MSAAVLDASALLAWLRDEPGADAVEPLLEQAHVSAVNWCETAQKLLRDGGNPDRDLRRMTVLGVQVYNFGPADALTAAHLWHATHQAGL